MYRIVVLLFISFWLGLAVNAHAQPSAKIIFLAGRPSHGYGSHEHLAGCRVLADAIQRSTQQRVQCQVIGNGWPEDDSELDGADAIVMYCDGGGGHPAIRHLPKLGELIQRGIGFSCLHYAVEVPTGRGGPEFLEWLGGYFETNWSVNPHWIANYTSLPTHEVTRGVKPFQANDEWYFHMRFRPEMSGVTPILSAIAPEHTMLRPDGPHSGNPAVRKEVAEKLPQHTAWVFERHDGGRSFGFTGGHFHWNWGREEILKLVCNAIVWTAKVDIPETGLPVLRPNVENLEQGQDEPIPGDHQRDKIQKEFQLESSSANAKPDAKDPEQQPAERDPKNAVSGLKVHDGLEVTLAASEPMIQSLTNLDVDHRGRVWVCEVVNYRAHLGKRPAGDRILILEDQDGNGEVDSSKVFYQGSDIDSAMGICVLGDRVIVSASPNVWVFTDQDGDDVPEKKELLFSNTGMPQHDHSAHSFIFGPDGKLYWNFGNTGKAVHDGGGNLVVDQSGKTVIDNGQPYYGGMVFRCNLDGSHFETLAHNFRNNYETAIDAFGTLWQTDNDDDGNKAARVNYVMEYGNYGYRDQLTGAGWQSPRINQEATVPERHWHLNDPGVVPTMLITGAGSPSALTFYEGELLPKIFCNQIIHCEPGHNVVRAYPVTTQGAGYQATIENLLQANGDNWFRPVDVCAAPDGSLWITDWYDPGVGGHAMGDLSRGRLFRVAPGGAKYQIAALDVSTPERAAAALVSPNQATRFLAWQAIAKFSKSAQSALELLSTDANPRHRARALWALGKLAGNGPEAVATALFDLDADVRCMGIRLARQLEMSPAEYFPKVMADSAPSVRRELAIALRLDRSNDMPQLWASLAASYDGGDRWMVEALGIGADLRWDDCFKAYIQHLVALNAMPHPDIVWRAKTVGALPYLMRQLKSGDLAPHEAAKLLRALDFQPKSESMSAEVKKTIATLMQNKEMSDGQRLLVVELLMMEPQAQSALDQGRLETILQSELKGASRSRKLEILSKFDVTGKNELLFEMSSNEPVDSVAVAAAEQILQSQQPNAAIDMLKSLEQNRQSVLIQSIAAGSPKLVNPFLQQAAKNDSLEPSIRMAAAKGLARSPSGSHRLLRMAEAEELLPEARMVIGSLLRQSSSQEIRQRAAELFPSPKSKTTEELPPIDKLITLTGNAQKGADIYRTTGTCAKCHPLGTDTRPVGPDLSEIGSKLAKEAFYVAILDPSAGISHNYESYSALTTDGQVITGLLISQTADQVVLRDVEGIDRTFARSQLEDITKLSTSLMPPNIVEQLSAEDLVDLVEYLQTLQKKP